MEAIATRVEAIASRLEAYISLVARSYHAFSVEGKSKWPNKGTILLCFLVHLAQEGESEDLKLGRMNRSAVNSQGVDRRVPFAPTG